MAAKTVTKWIARTLAFLFSALVIVTLAVGGVVLWAYNNPLAAFQKIEKYVLPEDLKITWKDVRFSGELLGGLNFGIDLEVDELFVKKGAPALDLPIHRTHIKASVFPLAREAKIHLVEAEATEKLSFAANPNAPPSPERNPFQQLQSIVSILDLVKRRLPVETAKIRADDFTYRLGSGREIKMKIDASKNPDETLNLVFAMDMPTENRPIKIEAQGELDFAKMGSGETFFSANLGFDGAGVETRQTFEMTYREESARLRSKGPIGFKREKMKLALTPELDLELSPKRSHLKLKSGVRGIPGPLVKVDDIVVDLVTPIEDDVSWSEKPSDFKVTAPIELFFVKKSQRALMEKNCDCKLPEIVKTEASGQVWLNGLLSVPRAKQTVVDGKVEIESVHNKIFAIDLAANVKIDRSPEGNSSKFEFFPYLNCSASILSFKSLMPLLAENKILVPAPFDILDGKIDLKANGPIATTEKGSKFPISLGLDLISKSQRVLLTTDATVDLKRTFDQAHLDVKALIDQLQLDLPPLDPLGGLPRIVADSRFVKAPTPKSPASKFKLSFNFEVETKTPGAIRLASHYFSPNLPVTLKLQAGNGAENSGFIQSEPFSVTYLRRTVKVESLRVEIDPKKEGVFPMKGRLSVKQTDYTVFIDIEGTTKNPAVTMSSEPYLPKDDIIAVLLYDRTNDQLISGDAEAAGGVQAAIADRAIGLFGLWAFASTPIKSFSYNPVTKVYTATVAVSDDLTAGIGTNWEESAHLELRKRVSKRWSLTAAWTPATPEEDATTKLVLQWEKRF